MCARRRASSISCCSLARCNVVLRRSSRRSWLHRRRLVRPEGEGTRLASALARRIGAATRKKRRFRQPTHLRRHSWKALSSGCSAALSSFASVVVRSSLPRCLPKPATACAEATTSALAPPARRTARERDQTWMNSAASIRRLELSSRPCSALSMAAVLRSCLSGGPSWRRPPEAACENCSTRSYRSSKPCCNSCTCEGGALAGVERGGEAEASGTRQ